MLSYNPREVHLEPSGGFFVGGQEQRGELRAELEREWIRLQAPTDRYQKWNYITRANEWVAEYGPRCQWLDVTAAGILDEVTRMQKGMVRHMDVPPGVGA